MLSACSEGCSRLLTSLATEWRDKFGCSFQMASASSAIDEMVLGNRNEARTGRVIGDQLTIEEGSHGPVNSSSRSSMHLKRRHSGTEVYGAGGKNIGEIDHLIIDKVSGRVAYAVMSFGGFVGLGHSHYPIPWGALTYDTSLGGFRTNITEQQLRDAPEFSDDSWQDRDWETRTHQYYGTPSYWESRGGLIR